MKIEIVSENKIFENVNDALIELAFCHYPVTVKVGDEKEIFDNFDDARCFVEESTVVV